MANTDLREAMPQTAAWIDQLREAFGSEHINSQIRKGLRGEPTFYSKENGHEIGTLDKRSENAAHRVHPSFA